MPREIKITVEKSEKYGDVVSIKADGFTQGDVARFLHIALVRELKSSDWSHKKIVRMVTRNTEILLKDTWVDMTKEKH